VETATKQRLIGIIVLLLLGSIFVPVFFSNEIPADERIHSRITLPPPPDVTVKHVNSTNKPMAKVRDTVEIPEVWVVQLGVFKDKSNAAKMIQDLRNKGFPAFTKLSKTGRETETRVFIGPEIDQQKAKETAIKLQQVFKIKGMVVRHKL